MIDKHISILHVYPYNGEFFLSRVIDVELNRRDDLDPIFARSSKHISSHREISLRFRYMSARKLAHDQKKGTRI